MGDMFTFVSGNLALDFAGTVHSRREDPRERLLTPADLGRWLVEANLADSAPDCDDAALRRAIEVREAAYRLASAALRDVPLAEADRTLINETARGELPRLTLRSDGSVARTGTVDTALTAVARAAIELLGSPDHARVKECGRPACTRLYIDTSRAGTRRWCEMARCGNRAKSAAFRARQPHDQR
ncbi:putative RNA-binding Zn ribbon-like protein [Nocardia transvalensis]|uniref:Putative RNA-binding Zn ribbon-like protein n=1 Tax=Nocardia transvalensis TaxID=37333 RepID=A0A7W9PDJ8_9NOCA|nr:ABATE domain-containing protein [Nocardia transvalensis]MBB5913941.1 putative RNA-binding Zn ribbon-like protein [Nocardia transvalensis]